MLICPWLGAFRAGRISLGISILGLQLSLLLWPVAVRLAHEFDHECKVQGLLDQISANYAHPLYNSRAFTGHGTTFSASGRSV
jgi:hypothetical protein